MPDGDIMKASLEGTFAGEPTVMDLGFVSGAGMPDFPSDAENLFFALQTALDLGSIPGDFLSPLSSRYRLDAIRIQDLSPGVSAGLRFDVGIEGGNETDDALPQAAALCVTWRTGLKGVANRGRTYLTGFAEDAQNAGFWIPEIQTWAGSQFAAALMSAFGPASAAGYALSVVHTVSAGVRLVPPTATPIISYTVNNTVRTIRKRGVGVRIARRPSTP